MRFYTLVVSIQRSLLPLLYLLCQLHLEFILNSG